LAGVVHEEKHIKFPKISGVDALKYLMELHELRQADLPEIGSQGVVSEVLKGKRHLNLKQIKLLSRRFNVAIETFIDPDIFKKSAN